MLILYYKYLEDKFLKITSYEALCNLGNNINEIYNRAINGDVSCFDKLNNYISDDYIYVGVIKENLDKIDNQDYNTRCNKLLLKNIGLLNNEIDILKEKYPSEKIGVIVASTNAGVSEFETTNNPKHFAFSTPALFLKEYLNLNGFYSSVSTACSSGLKAFSLVRDLFNSNILDAAIIACIDSLSKVPIYGFHSLEVLSNKPSIPFSKNRCGMNIGEASAIFITEKEALNGISVMGIGESSDIYHLTTPDPEAKESIRAINIALKEASLTPDDIDYINAHGTGTVANDVMEANAIYKIFKNNAPISSTKPMTGHCLGAASGIETALCCKLLDCFDGRLYPHIYDNKYDKTLPQINLVEKNKKYEKCNICMCNSFGFGGTNAIMILGKKL